MSLLALNDLAAVVTDARSSFPGSEFVKKSASNSEAGAVPRRNASGEARRGTAGLCPAVHEAVCFASPDNNFGFCEGKALAMLRRTFRQRLAGAKPRPQDWGAASPIVFHKLEAPPRRGNMRPRRCWRTHESAGA